MSTVKMVAVTIAGKLDEFDHVVNEYVYDSDIHLENAISVLGNKKRLQSFDDSVQYDSVVKSAESIMKLANITEKASSKHIAGMKIKDMREFLDKLGLIIDEKKETQDKLSKEYEKNKKRIKSLEHMKNITCDISRLGNLEFVKCRFGKIPRGGYKMFGTYLADLDIIFLKTDEDENNIWGFYFMPDKDTQRVDELFTSLYFERVIFPGGIKGNPAEISAALEERNHVIEEEIKAIKISTSEIIEEYREKLLDIYDTAKKRQTFAQVRALAAHSNDYFYIVGWMAEKESEKLEKRIEKDKDILLFYSEDPDNLKDIVKPPTKLKNNILFRPFEFFVKMYGYPAYNEIDPTPLMAITYILFFGMMFGDVGQSALFVIGGFLVYKFTKFELARIVGIVGISGTIFGFLYGSIFGNEEIIHGVLSPMHNITTLLLGTVAIGAFIIVFSIILNVINLRKNKEIGEMLFGHNGVSGLVFYVSLILLVVSIFLGINIPKAPFIVLLVVALLAMYFHEPLAKLVEGEKDWMPKEGIFYVQSIFEMVEVILSYFSNTISFLRIGAFAIVHVGMMMAVDVLAQGGTARVIIVSVLGNILVMVLEGIVVGIQVLRLEYYEMFSRYFTGNGKPFKSIKNK